MNNDALLSALYACLSERGAIGHIDIELFRRAYSAWRLIPIAKDGKIQGIGLMLDNAMHLEIIDKADAKSVLRRAIRAMLRPAIATWGFAKTTVQADNAEALEFCKRLGFKPVREDRGFIYLTCGD